MWQWVITSSNTHTLPLGFPALLCADGVFTDYELSMMERKSRVIGGEEGGKVIPTLERFPPLPRTHRTPGPKLYSTLKPWVSWAHRTWYGPVVWLRGPVRSESYLTVQVQRCMVLRMMVLVLDPKE